MLGKIFASFGGELVDRILGQFTGLFKAYFDKQISEAELKSKLLQTLIGGVTEIEKSHAEAITKTYATFMQAAVQSPGLMVGYLVVLYSQLAVLLWHQFGISALCYFAGTKSCWPSSGTTVDWSYALIAGMLGFGAVMQRMGPAKLDLDKLKSMIGK